jgi:hypothetical protein
MLRKTILSALLGLTALTGLAANARAADAAPAGRDWRERHERREEDWRRFHVYFRRDCRGPWECAGEYRSHEMAEREAAHLRQHGFEVMVRS